MSFSKTRKQAIGEIFTILDLHPEEAGDGPLAERIVNWFEKNYRPPLSVKECLGILSALSGGLAIYSSPETVLEAERELAKDQFEHGTVLGKNSAAMLRMFPGAESMRDSDDGD